MPEPVSIEQPGLLEDLKEALRNPKHKITLPYLFNLSGGPSGYGVQVWVGASKVVPVIIPTEEQSLGDILKMIGDLLEDSDG